MAGFAAEHATFEVDAKIPAELADGTKGHYKPSSFADGIGLGTSDSPQFAGVELGHATDTTLTRSAAGRVAVEGVPLGFDVGPRSGVSSLTIPAAVTVIRTNGYTTAGDGGGGGYIRVGSEPSHAGKVQDASGAWFELIYDPVSAVNALQFGAVFDNSTDDTTALQAMLDYVGVKSTALGNGVTLKAYLPDGRCYVSSLTITKPVHLIGGGPSVTIIRQNASTDAAAITVAVEHDGTDYYALGLPEARVTIEGLRLQGASRSSGLTNNNGIHFKIASSNDVRCFLSLKSVHTYLFANHGIYSQGIPGTIHAFDCASYFNGASGLLANSSTDQHYVKCNFFQNDRGVTLSGCAHFVFEGGCNIWANDTYGVYMFSSLTDGNNTFVGSTIDYNGYNGVYYDVRSVEMDKFVACYFVHNSRAASNTYAEVVLASTCTGTLSLVGCHFGRNYGQSGATALDQSIRHLGFGGSSATVLMDGTCTTPVAFVTNGVQYIKNRNWGTITTDKQLDVGDGTGAPLIRINGAAGQTRTMRVLTNGSLRWQVGAGTTAEGGANAGSNWLLQSYDDSGSLIETPFQITRSSGLTTVKNLYATGTFDLGHASDTTLSRLIGGTLGVEGRTIPYVLYQNGTGWSHTGDTSETTLLTVSVPAGAMGANGQVEIVSLWSCNNDASVKTARIRWGGGAGTQILTSSLANLTGGRAYTVIANRNSAASQIVYPAANQVGFGVVSGALVTDTVNTASAVDLVFTAQLADGTDNVKLEAVRIIVTYSA